MAKAHTRAAPRVLCKDSRITVIPNDNPDHGYIGHPKNIIHKDTGIILIYDPVERGWLRFGSAGYKESSLETHIWSMRDAIAYLDRVVAELRAGKIRPLTQH